MIPRSSKAKKFILGFLLLCFLLKWRSNKSGLRRENKLGLPTPLLEQPLDRNFNSKRVWVSIGLCYRCSSDHRLAGLVTQNAPTGQHSLEPFLLLCLATIIIIVNIIMIMMLMMMVMLTMMTRVTQATFRPGSSFTSSHTRQLWSLNNSFSLFCFHFLCFHFHFQAAFWPGSSFTGSHTVENSCRSQCHCPGGMMIESNRLIMNHDDDWTWWWLTMMMMAGCHTVENSCWSQCHCPGGMMIESGWLIMMLIAGGHTLEDSYQSPSDIYVMGWWWR